MTEKTNFLQYLQNSIDSDTFIRLTLSKPKEKSNPTQKIIIKLAIIKKVTQLSFVFREKTRDITKNFLLENGFEEIENRIGEEYLIANLFTTENDFLFEKNKKGKVLLKTNKPSVQNAPQRTHDKVKNQLIQSTDYLVELGVLDANGRVKKDKGDKYKQIRKFTEIIDGLVKKNDKVLKNKSLRVVDMGSGKGYLTFALYDHLKNNLSLDVEVVGVELRQELIDLCNGISQKVGFDGLRFESGFIENYKLEKTDMLIALHACDTATDDAIYKGIQAEAELIICAPCCHKQIRKQISNNNAFHSILQHGILKERQAEIVTDTIRALLLEASGYQTKVFEFISTEHTGKNVMIVGQKRKSEFDRNDFLKKVEDLKTTFGIEFHYLEKLMFSND